MEKGNAMHIMNTLSISPLSPCVSWGDVIVFALIWAAILFGVWKKSGSQRRNGCDE